MTDEAARPVPPDRAVDAALGRAIEAHRRTAGMGCHDVAAKAGLDLDGVDLAGLETTGTGLTPGRFLVLARAVDADPLALMAEALAETDGPEPPVGGSTRVLRALERLHPAKRELIHALILAFGET